MVQCVPRGSSRLSRRVMKIFYPCPFIFLIFLISALLFLPGMELHVFTSMISGDGSMAHREEITRVDFYLSGYYSSAFICDMNSGAGFLAWCSLFSMLDNYEFCLCSYCGLTTWSMTHSPLSLHCSRSPL
ncbi:hypothetical protein ASPZODRAFT_527554 [Penicilliopsis zonata CBS 506.65]|uniref:Uncharacterized protein n=1 Tax=Penicilliopsis zonata CBS 506.65 TaxID=1073090 RepID=A0A1L9SFD2_9EURO|nr:hypothetical protein ASPZODRAFT_527554 [Penicilliopsis zonata CBS 506.65]OJJ45787.1 hypothetical protein ASPZODRAFT_527554 [Penicilliopsis zonata CBS 506.65]